MRQIITSRLDTDLYKLTMGQFIWSFYPLLRVRYALIDRGNTQFPEGFAQELRRQVDLMSRLRLSGEESSYLSKLGIFNADYLSWFEANNYKPSQVEISQYGSCLTVIIEGPWVETVYWEVPLMSLISELYYKMTGQVPELVYPRASEMAQNLQQAGVIWTDFGSRRRAGFEVQGQALMAASAYMPTANTAGGLVGTSNVHWARVLGLESKGTMAHELFMALVAFYDDKIIGSRQVLAGWRLLYGENLFVVLPDTYTTDLFLSKILTPDEARMWAAIRQDSGDPKAFVDKVLVYYHKHRIDPMSKTIIFSDGLDTRSAIDLARYCQGKIKCLFGIGTSFTNNVGLKPLKIVIKIVQLMGSDGAWIPAVKESDDPAKSTGLASLKAAARA